MPTSPVLQAAPPEVRAELERHYRATLLRNLRGAGELLRVLQLLEGAGIPALRVG